MPKNTLKNDILLNPSELFNKGQYKALVDSYNANPASVDVQHMHFVIGALSFLGHTLEAEELFKIHKMSPQASSAALFYLGVGITRKSRYKKARAYFKKNQELYGDDKDPVIRFYSYQGIAFYLYFVGQYFRCEKYATKAFKLAVKAGIPEIKVLAQDLLAHTLIKTGQVSAGLQMFQDSYKLSKAVGNKAFTSAIEISKLLIEAEYGHRPQTIISELSNCFADLDAQDNYSKTNVALELAKQHTLRGEWKKAEEILNKQAPVIFAGANRRQEITLNLHWAKIAYYRGQKIMASQFLRSASLRLHAEADKNFAIQILSIELDLLDSKESPEALDKKNQLVALQSFASGIHRNMLSRRDLLDANLSPAPQEDLVHEALEKLLKISDPGSAARFIAKLGYSAWYFKCLPLKMGQNYLIAGIAKDTLTIITGEGISHGKLTGVSVKILEALRNGPVSKNDLVEMVWGYEYHPLRHDNLVYTAMSTLRKAFGTQQDWIQTLENGYRIRADLEFLNIGKAVKNEDSAPTANLASRPEIVDVELNFRQIQALEYLQENRFLNTRQYKDLFQTTEITASRDLAALNKKGFVLRLGHGRATQYTLSQKDSK